MPRSLRQAEVLGQDAQSWCLGFDVIENGGVEIKEVGGAVLAGKFCVLGFRLKNEPIACSRPR
jgi:hypothetical protein